MIRSMCPGHSFFTTESGSDVVSRSSVAEASGTRSKGTL
jgi:hypothetical protein